MRARSTTVQCNPQNLDKGIHYVSDRVLVMKHGKLVESGPTEDVIFRPRHEYTQQLLADVPRLHDPAG